MSFFERYLTVWVGLCIIAGIVLFIAFVLFVALPFLDRGSSRRSNLVTWLIALAVLVSWIAFSLYGMRVA